MEGKTGQRNNQGKRPERGDPRTSEKRVGAGKSSSRMEEVKAIMKTHLKIARTRLEVPRISVGVRGYKAKSPRRVKMET